MKVFTLTMMDMYESVIIREVGVFDAIEKAREAVKENIRGSFKAVIYSTAINEVYSQTKEEVYTFESGLEYSRNNDIDYGSMQMVQINSEYYEADEVAFEKRLIPVIVDDYMKVCESLNCEPEIDYVDEEEFLNLKIDVRDHVLYHAEMSKDAELQKLYEELNAA